MYCNFNNHWFSSYLLADIFCCPHFLFWMKRYICRYMESKDPTVFTKTYEEGVERVLKVMIDGWSLRCCPIFIYIQIHIQQLIKPIHPQGNFAFLCESAMLDYFVQQDCNLTQIGGLLDSKVSYWKLQMILAWFYMSIRWVNLSGQAST